ncbi:MAG: leucine-rich repeat protein [Bacteroidales bacterium]|nr:leucine-rich repeat protein [Bacteroidales bacterium]
MSLIAFMACSGSGQEEEPITFEPARVTFSAPVTRFLLDNVDKYDLKGIFQEEGFVYERDLPRFSSQLKYINIEDPKNNYKITDLSDLLSVLNHLGSLGVEGTGIKKIDLSGKTGLHSIGFTDVKTLTELNVSGCSRLEFIRVSGCPLDSLDLSGCTNLREVELSRCGIRKIDIRPSPNIEKLSVSELADGSTVRVSLTQFQKDRVELEVPENTIWDIEGAEDRISIETGDALNITSVGARIVVKVEDEGLDEWQRGLLLSSEETPVIGNSDCFVIQSAEESSSVTLDHLVPGTTYYARGFVRYLKDGKDLIRYGNIVSFTTNEYMRENMMSEYVDMGLSVLWAKRDLEISQAWPYLSGNDHVGLYAWGETSCKESFSEDNYTYDKDEIILEDSDPARAFWKGDWRMPTKDEFQELIDNCDISFSESSRVYTFVSRINGQSITFVPYNHVDYFSWTSRPSGDKAYAFSLEDGHESARIQAVPRYEGLAVRPVVSSPVNQKVITFQDGVVRQICVEQWDRDGDGDLSLEEAASVTDIGDIFKETYIEHFDEFQYFTGVEEFRSDAFYMGSVVGTLVHITLPPNLKRIPDGAFKNCVSLERIDIPDGLESLGTNVFENCRSLKRCKLPNWVADLPDYLFSGCSMLSEIIFGTSIRRIGTATFSGCSSLKDFPVENGLESIGAYAFEGCSSMEQIMIPNTVTSIGEGAFSASGLKMALYPDMEEVSDFMFLGCESLERVEIQGEKTSVIGKAAFCACDNLKEVVFPPNLKTIRDEAFMACPSLKAVHVSGNSLALVGREAFINCSGLKEVSFDGGSGNGRIDYRAFAGCESLSSLTIGEGFTSLAGEAFSGCSSLESISLPQTFKAFEGNVFKDCCSLPSLKIPDKVTSLGSEFSGCTTLSEIVLPEGLSYIGAWAFSSTAVSTLTIPANVKRLNFYSFYDAPSLKTIIMEGKTPPEVFFESAYPATKRPLVEKEQAVRIIVPKGCRNSYMEAPYWDSLGSILEEIEESE